MITCRFCLSDHLDQNDLFITPCMCKGSMKFIHYNCLKKWLDSTQDASFKNTCQVCKTLYNLPRRWQLEKIPVPGLLWQIILSNVFYISLLVYYIHLNLIIFTTHSSLIKNPRAVAHVMHDTNGLMLYNVTLALFTTFYAYYLIPYFMQIKNPWPYLYYGFVDHIFQIIGIILCLYLTQYSIFPFGGFYLAILERYLRIHIKILHIVNLHGIL
jgi:E3 ubiquitin-protein ligase DOA10